MRRTGQKRAVPFTAAPQAPPALAAPRQIVDESREIESREIDEALASTVVETHRNGHADVDERYRMLELAIEQRIESRVRGRVRNLSVRVFEGLVILQGACSTYYTKQLAQHAALGILEEEHLENEIVVQVVR
jgi:hypothetical protein